MKRLLRSWFPFLRRRRFEDGMAEEMRFHLAAYADDLVRSGLAPDEAARRARMEFGSLDNAMTDCREARGLRVWDEFQQYLRQAARGLSKAPGLSLTLLLTLGICLG